jgi:integrase
VEAGGARAAKDSDTACSVRSSKRAQPDDATVNQLLDRHLAVVEVEESTRKACVGYLDVHVRPMFGALPLSKLDGEVLDTVYAQVRRCHVHCDRRRGGVDHRTKAEHECDERCRAHACRPLAASTVRQIHWILSGAMERAVRWRWIPVSPTGSAQPPPPPAAKPSPPSAKEATRLLEEAWKDEAWGTLVWLAMTTGARRGELCALRRRHLDLDEAVLTIESGVAGSRARMREKDTKTHQKRRVALDESTVAILQEHLVRQARDVAARGSLLTAGPYLFSLDPNCERPLVLDSVLSDSTHGRTAEHRHDSAQAAAL